jgi:hypothetical protein
MKSATKLQPGKAWGKSPFGRARNRSGDKIRMNHRETVHVDTYEIWLTLVGSCEHGNEPLGSINAGNFLSC